MRRAPAALHDRVEQIAADARQLTEDLRAARDAAAPGDKAPLRYLLRKIEPALVVFAGLAK